MPYQAITNVYTHEQTILSDTWTIIHNLDLDAPVVDCWCINVGELTNITPISVTVTDVNTVSILFDNPRTGYASVV